VALAAEPLKDATSIAFVRSPENQGAVCVEPAAPFYAAAVPLEATSNNNNVVLPNGRKVSDAGAYASRELKRGVERKAFGLRVATRDRVICCARTAR
jgi:hypothetical protein